MFRMWGRIKKNNRVIKDTTISVDDESLTRTEKVFKALDDICYEFDLGKPIWLDANIHEFQVRDKTRFNQDNFIEAVSFDCLEIEVIEE